MSRSGYVYDYDEYRDSLPSGRYRGQVASAIRGKRGQRLFIDMLAALDAMPVKELIAGSLVEKSGAVCALGAVAAHRGIDVVGIDPEDSKAVSLVFDIAEPLAKEIADVNDDDYGLSDEPPAQRWMRVRDWVSRKIRSAL